MCHTDKVEESEKNINIIDPRECKALMNSESEKDPLSYSQIEGYGSIDESFHVGGPPEQENYNKKFEVYDLHLRSQKNESDAFKTSLQNVAEEVRRLSIRVSTLERMLSDRIKLPSEISASEIGELSEMSDIGSTRPEFSDIDDNGENNNEENSEHTPLCNCVLL